MIKALIVVFITGAWAYYPPDTIPHNVPAHYIAGEIYATECEQPFNEQQRCVKGDTVFVSYLGWCKIDSIKYKYP